MELKFILKLLKAKVLMTKLKILTVAEKLCLVLLKKSQERTIKLIKTNSNYKKQLNRFILYGDCRIALREKVLKTTDELQSILSYIELWLLINEEV